MFTLTIELALELPAPGDPENVTDVIEVLLDSLDAVGLEPDIGSHHDGSGPVTLRVELTVDAPDALTAQAVGAEALRKAIESAPEPPSYGGIESSARVLEPA